jgi:AraC family transcriptional regulator
MTPPAVNTRGQNASDITLVDVPTGVPFPVAHSGSVLLSSAPLGWRGIVVEWHRREPREMPEHYLLGYGLAVSTGERPISFGWN